MLMCEDIEIN